MKEQPKCPECEKLSSVFEDSQKLGEFLEWLKQKYYLCEFDEQDEQFFQVRKSVNDILAEYYGIDLEKVEKERRVLLEWLREVQTK